MKQSAVSILARIRCCFVIIPLLLFAPSSHAQGWQADFEAGRKEYKAKNVPAAIRFWESGLKRARESGDKKGAAECLKFLGFAHEYSKDYGTALRVHQERLSIIRELGDERSEGPALSWIADQHMELGNHDKALESYRRSLEVARRRKDREGEAFAIRNIGMAYAAKREYRSALESYQRSLEINQSLGNQQAALSTLSSISEIHLKQSDFRPLIETTKRMLDIFRGLGDAGREAEALTAIGNTYIHLNESDSAEPYFLRALPIQEARRDRLGESKVLAGLGNTYAERDVSKAIGYFEKALAIKREFGDRKGEAEVLSNLATVYDRIHSDAKALDTQQMSLKISREIGNAEGEAASRINLSRRYALIGDYPSAMEHSQKAREIAVRTANRKYEAVALRQLALLKSGMGDSKQAIEHALEALRISERFGLPGSDDAKCELALFHLEQGNLEDAVSLSSKCLIVHEKVLLRKRDYRQARDLLREELRLRLWDRYEVTAERHIGLGLAYEGLGEWSDAKSEFLKAVTLVERHRDVTPRADRGGFFTLSMTFSRSDPYEGLVRIYQVKESPLFDPGKSFFWAESTKARSFIEMIRGEEWRKAASLPQAYAEKERRIIEDIKSAYANIESTARKSGKDQLPALESEVSRLYERRRDLIAELKTTFPEYAALRYPEPIRASETALVDREILLEYEVTEDRIYAFLVDRTGLRKTIEIPIKRKDLEAKIIQFRRPFENISEIMAGRFDLALGKELYDLLLDPVISARDPKTTRPFISPIAGREPRKSENDLSAGSKIIVVPDEILGLLPFEALVVSLPQQLQMPRTMSPNGTRIPTPVGVVYVGDSFDISYAQSATALTLQRRFRDKTETGLKSFVLADPVFDATDPRSKGAPLSSGAKDAGRPEVASAVVKYMGISPTTRAGIAKDRVIANVAGQVFPRLDRTSILANHLQEKVFGRSQCNALVGLDANERRLRDLNLSQYRNLLFATHGILDGQIPYIQEPALVLTQLGTDVERDGFLTMSEVMKMKLNSDMVALIACQTGLGRRVRGEGVLGLGRAFQCAGAKAVLMSLWSVAEESTTTLTEHFFSYLKQGRSNRDALRLARQDIRRQGFDHPFFWAPFILMGD